MGSVFGLDRAYGVIVNKSMVEIEYLVYGANQQIRVHKSLVDINPAGQFQIKSLKFSGAQSRTQIEKAYIYKDGAVKVGPNSKNNAGLSRLKYDQHRISIRANIKKDYIIYLATDVLVSADDDICWVITPNLTARNMTKKQIDKIIRQNPEDVPVPIHREEGNAAGVQGGEQHPDEDLDEDEKNEKQMADILSKQFGNGEKLCDQIQTHLKNSYKKNNKVEQETISEELKKEQEGHVEVVYQTKEAKKEDKEDNSKQTEQKVELVNQVVIKMEDMSLKQKEEQPKESNIEA